jgi:hypothetical protein
MKAISYYPLTTSMKPGVEIIYSTDKDLKKYAAHLNIKYCGLADLPTPPSEQARLPFEENPKVEIYSQPSQTNAGEDEAAER